MAVYGLNRSINKLYDSCVDKVPNPQIFVVFDRNQCYPEYLFMYTDRDTVPDPYPIRQVMAKSHFAFGKVS
jgi:hypothetical protein